MKNLVIIPTYNEKENIEAIITAVMELPIEYHILVIDDGSPDGTATIVKDLMINKFAGKLHLVERAGKLGLGTAYIAGFKWAIEHKYDYIFEMDADFSHNPQDLLKLYDACANQGADVAIGSRYVSGVNVVNRIVLVLRATSVCAACHYHNTGQRLVGLKKKGSHQIGRVSLFIVIRNGIVPKLDIHIQKFSLQVRVKATSDHKGLIDIQNN